MDLIERLVAQGLHPRRLWAGAIIFLAASFAAGVVWHLVLVALGVL
jgi:hypothetical protein